MTDNENQGATVDRIIARSTPTDGEVNTVALHYWGPSVIYDREKLREALALIRNPGAHTPTDTRAAGSAR